MRIARLSAAVLLSLGLGGASASATIIDGTYSFTASGFQGIP